MASTAGWTHRLILLALLVPGALPHPVAAQSTDCILDNCADKRPPMPQEGTRVALPRGSGRPGDFDFYVLSLSWSSGFCETASGARTHAQCDSGAGLGFVVHGLWPQYEKGYPTECGPSGRSPSRIALEGAQGLYPDEGLARYEWRKHGTCSGKSPTDYFADVRKARDAIVIPLPFQGARANQTWTPLDIERAFMGANPRLRPGMLGIACVKGVLREVRICFSKDLRDFHACPEIGREGCHAREISVPPAL